MIKKTNLCNPANYGGKRTQAVKYIVIHYTAGNGDTDENNAAWFARADTGKTSAHWFVDDDSATLSVPEDRVAYHCGAVFYYHPECRNSNSIGVELCSITRGGVYAFKEATVTNAVELVAELMRKYNVPLDHVIRHYDVTHKTCPAPFVGAGQAAWEDFKQRLEEATMKRYNKIADMPSYAKDTVEKLVDKKMLNGGGKEKDADGRPADLNLSEDMIRMLVILDRAGVFG